MFWFGRPSQLRRAVAALLVIGAAVIEFRPVSQDRYPFTAAPVATGSTPRVEWRTLPAGLYEPPALSGAVAGHAMAAGEPITASDLRTPVDVPDGWWALAVDVPAVLPPGAAARLVLATGVPVPGVVLRSEAPDAFDLAGPSALIAVPAEEAGRVAAAVAADQIVVLVSPGDIPGASTG